jgi:hypothetical protein
MQNVAKKKNPMLNKWRYNGENMMFSGRSFTGIKTAFNFLKKMFLSQYIYIYAFNKLIQTGWCQWLLLDIQILAILKITGSKFK